MRIGTQFERPAAALIGALGGKRDLGGERRAT